MSDKQFNPKETTNLIEFANSLKLPERKETDFPCELDAMAMALGVIDYEQNLSSTEIREFHVIRWYCTDSYVGAKFFYLREKFIAYSTQEGRKCDERFTFMQEEIPAVRTFLESLIPDKLYPEVNIIKKDETIPLFYKIGYASQLLEKTGFTQDGIEHSISTIQRSPVNPGKPLAERKKSYAQSMKDEKKLLIIKDGVAEEIGITEIFLKTRLHP